MNKHLFRISSLLLLVALFFSVNSFGQKKYLSQSEIPTEISTYVQKHFPGQSITYTRLKHKMLTKEYKVKLNDRTELKFDSKKKIIEADSKTALPESIIPQALLAYVKKEYPQAQIKEWKLKRNYQEIELNNGLELEFTLNGNFIRIDN